MVFIGNISFSLYLFHYILFYIFEIKSISFKAILIIIGLFFISYIFYKLIESNMKYLKLYKYLIIILCGVIVLLYIKYTI